MADGNEYAAVPQDDAQLLVKEGEEIDYSIVLGFYLIADLRESAARVVSVCMHSRAVLVNCRDERDKETKKMKG